MSFDINPLGNTIYLKQLEREASQMKTFRQAATHEETQAKARPASAKSLLHLAIHSLWPRSAA